jgi:hypothetical protein
MSKEKNQEEREYLVRTEFDARADEWANVVRQVFHLEHGCTKDYEIAAVLGVDDSRVSQILKTPRSLRVESIEDLTKTFKSPRNRRLVIKSWTIACFGKEAIAAKPLQTLTTKPTKATIKRIDARIREGRYEAAASMCALGISGEHQTEDYALRQMLYDRLFASLQRLDRIGEEIAWIDRALREAILKHDHPRECALLHWKLMVSRRLMGIESHEVHRLARDTENRMSKLPVEKSARQEYATGTPELHRSEILARELADLESGRVPVEAERLKSLLDQALAELHERRSHQETSRGFQLAVRVHLLLGNDFLAEELIDKMYESGELKLLNITEIAGLFKGIVIHRRDPEAGAEYFLELAEQARAAGDLYHHRIIQREMARLLIKSP